ncbi:MAG: TerC/Alx family metal homeostasis membrane protein [Puniceicoccales bacterium]|nr:TerC/Alx family metal homeostasis membrane protein [Puniceicoccales bacterium]
MERLCWFIFCAVTTIGLTIDVVALKKHRDAGPNGTHLRTLVAWLAVVALFGALLYFAFGGDSCLKFFTGYLLELSLSIDNLFLFMAVFANFKISSRCQQKALTYGIIGAIVLRVLFLSAGIALFNKFAWLAYILGSLLIISAFGVLKMETGSAKSPIPMAGIRNFFGLKRSADELAFFSKEGTKLRPTSLFVCTLVLTFVDVVFAWDSIPAVLAITHTPLLAFSSNILAIIGLRSLYVYLALAASEFHMLKYGIAANLIFVGVKTILSDSYQISTTSSFFVVVSILGIAVLLSILTKKPAHFSRQKAAHILEKTEKSFE